MRCKTNDVIEIVYGDSPNPRICRVLKVRDLSREPLCASTLSRRPDLQRTDTLVTCQDTNGQVRNFYVGLERSFRKVHPLCAAILYLKGKLPARTANG
jgi:hypothetical protein